MVEPMVVVSAAARAVQPVMAGSRLALRKLRQFGTLDLRWLDLGGSKGLSASEVGQLELFLDQRETRALLSVLAATLLMPDNDIRTGSIEKVKTFYLNQTQKYRAEHPCGWYDRREEVWEALLRIYDRATPAGDELAAAAVEFEDFLRTPLDRTRSGNRPESVTLRYIERMAELCSDINRVVGATGLVGAMKSALAHAPTPPIITYRATSSTAAFADLYVGRTLVHKESDSPLSGRTLGNRGAPFRAVVHGAPGAGKSTFVKHLRRELADDPDSAPALLLTLRNYFPVAKTQSIAEYLSEDARTSLNVENDPAAMRDVLTLGLVTVIFDGLDEITDINTRVEMVSRISSFAREFPAVSVLVTSRSVGYERAPLPSEMFQTYVLHEYTPDQSREYVGRWFTFIGRSDLTEDFERESESVRDLRSNPLLLSLLCILYGERGSIPRRRRDIYAQCADLLFHTWDSHRHIDQPEELHANGDRIMQEIAQWVYKSQKAQGGLSERVIQKTIGQYLQDTVGVEEGEARRRAGEFLEFCATRAWLLGVTGTEHGERMFGFTHRTFFEFFAAEAFSRTSGDPSAIATILLNAHRRDATSVLPELLLQAIDDKVDRGGARTFREVCGQTDDESLILRLMEGVGLPANVRAQGFDRVLQLWQRRRAISKTAFVALLSLNLDARNQFIREYLVPERAYAVDLFLGGWVSLEGAGGAVRHAAAWSEVVDRIADGHVALEDSWYHSEVEAWMWRTGRASVPNPKVSMYLTSGAWGNCLGSLWYAIEGCCGAEGAPARDGADELFAAAIARARSADKALDRAKAVAFVELLLERLATSGPPDASNLSGEALWSYIYAVGIVYEVTRFSPQDAEELEQSLPALVRALWDQRRAVAEVDTMSATKLPSEASDLPAWARSWGRGKRSFVV